MIAIVAATLLLLANAAVGRAEPPLQALARETVGEGQGVFVVAEDGSVLAEEAATRAVHPASVTKVATTLALLQRLGPEHRFETRLVATGPRDGDLVHGDLLVEASGDPFLVDEGAFLMLRRLHELGVRRIAGGLIVHGPLLFDWERDPRGAALTRTLSGKQGADAWGHDGALALGEAALVFRGKPPGHGAKSDLLTYRSPPLLAIVKALNGYSNNVFHLASDAIGGPEAVTAIARASVPSEMSGEIILTNGAGAGSENRLSPRAAVALIQALGRELARHGRVLTDVLPVSGIDPGTLRERLRESPAAPAIVVGKTGTFGSQGASALAGQLRTTRYGTITFAVLNHGVPVPDARRRQDAFVTKLVVATGAEPWPYRSPAAPAFAAAEVR